MNIYGRGKQYTTWATKGFFVTGPTFYNDKGERINMERDYIVNHFAAESKLIKRIGSWGE